MFNQERSYPLFGLVQHQYLWDLVCIDPNAGLQMRIGNINKTLRGWGITLPTTQTHGTEGSWLCQAGTTLTSSIFQPADGIGEESDTPQEASSLFLVDFFMVPYADGYGIRLANVSRKTHIGRVILEKNLSFLLYSIYALFGTNSDTFQSIGHASLL